MFDRHFAHWPRHAPKSLMIPETTLPFNLEISARRYPQRIAIHFYGGSLTYQDLWQQVEAVAGFLQKQLGVVRGDRVLLYMQNSPQFIIAYQAILRADAVVIPVNPMNRQAELEHYVRDTGAVAAFAGQELASQICPHLGTGSLAHLVIARYGDYAAADFDLAVPEAVRTPPLEADSNPAIHLWADTLGHPPAGPALATPDDLAVFPYSSGTTGNPKGCVHTHRSVMAVVAASAAWAPITADAVHLVCLPLFHVTGMQTAMNTPIFSGSTMVVMTRWDRRVAVALIRRHRVTRWRSIATMAIDLINDPESTSFDLSSLAGIGGGGATMPDAVAARLKSLVGLDYIEGYGLSETMASTHINPTDRPRPQCLGIPIFDVDCRIINLDDGRELPPGEIGEIVIHGPQLFQGYWNDPEATAAAFVEIDGKRFLRTGDLGRYDEDGYFYIVDRLKRMINASGFKVWPTEVESLMMRHPGIAEACVIASPDPRRGETVKALVVVREGHRDSLQADDIIRWCHTEMAAYKCPTRVIIQDALPRSATGKVQWRELQEKEWTA